MATSLSPEQTHRQQWWDAHCHRLPSDTANALPTKLLGASINSTSPEDWLNEESVLTDITVIRGIGLHPWFVHDWKDTSWKKRFIQTLEGNVATVGEIGLHFQKQHRSNYRTIASPGDQVAAFQWQLEAAADANLPVSIHCVNATEALLKSLSSCRLPSRGVHLHDYRGSPETIHRLHNLNTWFSISAIQRKQLPPTAKTAENKWTERIQAIPIQRLMIETDLQPNDLITTDRVLSHFETTTERIAATLDLEASDVRQTLYRNAAIYFSLQG